MSNTIANALISTWMRNLSLDEIVAVVDWHAPGKCSRWFELTLYGEGNKDPMQVVKMTCRDNDEFRVLCDALGWDTMALLSEVTVRVQGDHVPTDPSPVIGGDAAEPNDW